jgi:hypothetical protein
MSEKRTNSRAEEVRERRNRAQVNRHEQATEQAYRPLPPVTSRDRSGYGVSGQSRKANQRRYNIAITLPGKKVHRQPLISVKVGPRFLPVILIILLGAVLYFLTASPVFRVTEPQITGLSRLTAAEINATLGINGDLIFLLQPEEIATRLRLNHPELTSAEVTIALPDQVRIEVTERVPVLLWQQGDGFTWIDALGVAFRPHGETPALVTVIGMDTPPGDGFAGAGPLNPPAFLAPDLVKTALVLAPSVPQGSTLTYESAHGFGWTDSRGWKVFFGTSSKDVVLKLRVYQSLVDSLVARGIYPGFISVVHADAPYYRMEQ